MDNYPPARTDWPLDKQTLPVPGTKKPGFSAIYRNAAVPELKTDNTAYDTFHYGKSLNPKADCAGWRPWNPVKKDLEPYFEWLSFEQVEEQRTAIGSALSVLARQGNLGEGVGQTEWTVSLWVLNRPEYLIVDQSALAYSRRIVSLYDSYDTPTACYILDHAEARIVFTTPSHVGAVLSEAQKGKLPFLKGLVILDPSRPAKADLDKPFADPQRDLLATQWAATLGIQTYSWLQLLELGRSNLAAHIPPSPDTIASFCYTSGTTGNPKAAIITCGMAGFCGASFGLHTSKAHTLISYLPTAHIYARGVESMTLRNGGRIGFFNGDTNRLMEDMQILKPTFFPSVPRVLNRIAGLIEGQMRAPGLKAKLLRTAVETKIANHDADGTLTHALYDRLVFSKVKAVLGGNVEFITCGSAPIRPEVLRLLRIALICDAREGYGQTENFGICLLMNPGDKSLGSCGPCVPGIEFKLRDVPELGYTCNDQPFPRGELLSRGQNTFPGYFKDEAKTKETLDQEGWLHSGDIVSIDQYNRVRIIDRVKSLVKLSQGEYVAIDSLNEFYGQNSLASQVLIHGDSFKDYLIAIAVPEATTFVTLINKIKGSSILSTDLQALEKACQDQEIVKAFLQEYTNIAKKNNLKGFEYIKGLMLTMKPFSIENGLLTPTFKLKRHQAIKFYKLEIDQIYSKGPVVSSSSSKL